MNNTVTYRISMGAATNYVATRQVAWRRALRVLAGTATIASLVMIVWIVGTYLLTTR